MYFFLNILAKITGNRISQVALEFTVRACQYLMGIGAGSKVADSGEKIIFSVLKERIKPPYSIFDIGANKGQFLRLTLSNVPAKDSTIHCFEPGHETYKELAVNAVNLPNVTLNNFAIGKENTQAILHFDQAGSGLASLTKRRLDHFQVSFDETETIEIETIDRYCKANGIDRINLLKIDIEGHELDALAGARGMFENRMIDLVTFEFGGGNIDTKTYFQDFWYFFAELDMKLYRITPSGYLNPLTSYKEMYEQFRTTNFLAMMDPE